MYVRDSKLSLTSLSASVKKCFVDIMLRILCLVHAGLFLLVLIEDTVLHERQHTVDVFCLVRN